jgi:hypothetical protein
MRYGPVNVTTFVIFGFALWVIYTRIRNKPDNNWPMIFYPVIAVYITQLPGRIDFNAFLVGIIAALLLRFEFVGGFVTPVVRVIDLAALVLVSYSLFRAVTF